MTFQVVSFYEEGEFIFNAVPEVWIVEDNGLRFAWWPPKGTTNVDNLIKNGETPKENWKCHFVEESTPPIEGYEEAKKFEKIIIKLGSLSKGYEAQKTSIKLQKRVRFLPPRPPGESTTEEEDLTDLTANHKLVATGVPLPPKRKKTGQDPKEFSSGKNVKAKGANEPPSKEKIAQGVSEASSVASSESDFELGNVPLPSHRVPTMEDTIEVLASVPEVDGQSSTNEITVCACSGQDKLRKEMNELKGQLNEVLMNQEVLLREIRAMRSSSLKDHPSVYQCPIAMPITSLEMLAEVDSMLALNSEFRVYMFHWFSGHLTTNLGQFVRNNLSKVISNKVAEGLSWAGRKGKRSMKDFHNLINVLTDAAKNVGGRYEEKAFQVEVSNWLCQASRRKTNTSVLHESHSIE